MKRIRLLEYPPEGPLGVPLNERDLLLQIVRQAPDQRGWSLDEVRQGIRLLDALEPATVGDVVGFEDADYAQLVERARNFRWAWVDRRIDQFVRHLETATDNVMDDSAAVALRANGHVFGQGTASSS